jgi:CheY-specific phosphatase CheX
MKEGLEHLFGRVIAETLEGLAFVFAFDEGEGRKPDGPCVELAFSGPFAGAFFLWMDDSLLDEVTENMLGMEEGSGISAAEREDALKETANVICGNLLPEIGGRDAVFDLLPVGVFAASGFDGALKGRKPCCEVTLSVDEAFCVGALWLEDENAIEGLEISRGVER